MRYHTVPTVRHSACYPGRDIPLNSMRVEWRCGYRQVSPALLHMASERAPDLRSLTSLGDAGAVLEGGVVGALAGVAQGALVLLTATLAARVALTLADCMQKWASGGQNCS